MNDKLSQFTQQESGVQSFQSTKMWDEINKTREEALESTIAGLHFPEPIKPTTTYKPQDQSNPYEIQREALSKINLLDESLQPTDTYTNYINKGNTPIPGLEDQHDTLLFLDRQQEKIQQHEGGLITEDQMLMDLYGRDILEYNGYNVMSVGWWQNKFHNNDFTTPFDNKYLMYQVTEQARNYHNQLLAKKYSQDAKVSNSHLSTLLSKGDLSNQDIKTLFPELAEAINETQDSKDYQKFITSGQISAQQRIHQTSTGERYYLHTDGELYRLSNEGGQNTARYKEDEAGNITEISLNSGDLADYAHSFKAGAASIVSNTAKLVWGLWGATAGYAIQGLTEGDWDWVDSITDSTNWLDSQFNDNLSAVFDSRYVDLDGFKINDAKDWGMFLSQTTGAVLFGAWSGGKASSLAQWASKFNTRSGKILTQALNLYARSTGNYKGYVPKESTVSLGAWALNSAHLQTVETYFLKDFISNVQTLNNQKTELALNEYLKDPDSYDPSKWNDQSWSIFGHSLSNAALNGFISMAFAGGIDDNQAARWAELLEKKNKLGPINLSALGKSLQKHKLAFNTTTDFLDNILTMYSSAIMGYNEDTGSIEWNRNMSTYDENGEYTGFNTALFVRTAAQAAIQTAPTLMSNLQNRNIMGENILAVGDAWIKKLNDLETKAANPEAKKLAQTVRIDYLNDIKNCKEVELSTGEKVAPSPEQRVAYALDRAQSRLKTEAIPNLIDDICNPITLKVYKDAIDLSIEQYNKTLKRHTEMETEIKKKGIKAIKEYFSNGIKNNFSNHIAVEKYKESIKNIDDFVDKMYDSYLTLTDSKESATTQERLIARINLTSEMLEEVEETHMTYRSLIKGRKELKDKVLNAAAEYANRVGLDSAESVIGASKFYRFKNESEDRDTLNIERAAMELMSEAVPYAVYKIDDNTYGMVAMDKEITNLFHTDTAAKFSLAMHALGKGTAEDKQAAIDLIITTLIGDQAVKNFKRGKYNKAATKETVEAILNTAIKNKVINKKQAAELLINLTETDSEIGKSLSTVFETNVSTKSVNNLKNLSELEKYTLIYESINHLKNTETKRFSGKTVAAEALLQQKYDAVVLEVLDDLKGQLPEALKSYYIKAKGEDLFPLATDSIMRHLTNVIGEKGLVNFEESDVETYLRSLGTNASEPALQQAAKDLMECINTLKNFKSIQFDGDSVTLDLSAWSHKQYRNMVNEILRTDVSSRKSREEKDNSYKGMSEYAAQRTLDVNKKYKGSNITIELKDSNMDAITELYNLLVDGGFIDDEFSVKPKTAEDMKKILSRDLSDEGRIFAKYKNNTEFDTNIISDKDAKIIQDKLKTFSTEEIIDTVTVIDPRKGSQIRYDYYTILGSNIQINKISKKMDSLMRRNKNMPIYINPVDINTLGTEKNGAPMYITYDEGYTSKRGRISKEGGSIQRVVNSHAEAAMVNKDLALITMIDSYIDYIVKNPEQIKIVIPSKYYSDLKELGIIDSEDSFYVSKEMYSTIEDPNADVSYMQLTLKDGVTKLDMEYYLLHDEDPNLFKVLPFVSDNKLNADIPFTAPEGHKLSFIPDITGGLTTDYTGLYSIMNMNFDYDQKGILKQNLFEDLFSNAENTNFIFNPFSEMRKPINKNSLEEYIKYRESGELEDGINDPYYELVKSYININEKYIAGDNEENDDYKIWLQNGNVLKKIIKAIENKQKISEAFITDIINTYKDTTDFDNIVGYKDSGYSYNNISTDSRISTASNMNSDTAMSKNILDASIGIDYQLVDVNGKAYDGAEVDIKKAFKYVQDNIEALREIQDITTSPYIGSEDYILYRPTSSSELWAILSASEGRITIEDLDRLRRLEADAYNEFFEKLGMSNGYGNKIKNKVDTLYDKLKALMTNQPTIRHRISKNIDVESGTENASIRQTAETVPFNPKSKKDKHILNRIGRDYIEEYIDTPQITSQRLVDAMEEKYDYFTDTLDQDLSTRDEYNKAVYNQIAKTQIEDNNDFRRQSLITDISSNMNLAKMVSTTKHTHESLTSQFDLGNNKTIRQNLIDYSASLTQRMSGTRYLSNYAKYSFLDLSTGKEYAMANIQKINGNKSNVDLLLTIWDDSKTNNDWIGKAFITLDKHSGDDPSGLNYSYKVLETEQDVINLKNDIMLEVIKENDWRLNDVEGKTIKDKFDRMTNTEQTNFMNKIIAEGIGIRDKEKLLDNVLSKTNIQEKWKFKFLPVDYKSDLNKETIRDVMGTNVSALFSSDEGTRRIAHAIIFGIDYDSFDTNHKASIDVMLTTIQNYLDGIMKDGYVLKNNSKINDIEYKINTGNKMTDTMLKEYRDLYGITNDLYIPDTNRINPRSSIVTGIMKYLVKNGRNPEVLDYFCNNKKSLVKRYTEYKHGYSDTYKLKEINGASKELSVADIKNFYEGKTSTLKKIEMFDTEGSNKTKANGETANSIRDLFQISIITDEIVDGKLVSKQNTYFIKHDLEFAKWVEENIDYNDDFFRTHKGYQEAVQAYKDLTGDESNVLTEQQVFDLLNGTHSYAPDLLIAYNGDNYEFRVLKNGLNSDITTLDAMQAVMKRESDTTKSIAQDPMYKQYKRNFGQDFSDERHSADQDTRDMREMLTEDYFRSDYAISEDRSKLIKDILNLIPEDYRYNDTIVANILKYTEDCLYNIPTVSEMRSLFNNYNPTLDNIKELQRAYNYMTNNARGNVFFKLREQLGYDTVYGRLVSDNTSKYNVIDALAIKMLETNGDVEKAFDSMWYAYRNNILNKNEELNEANTPSTQDFIEKLMMKDSETLGVLGIREDLISDENVSEYRKTLLNQFNKGLDGFDNGKILNISKKMAKDFRETEYLNSYITAVESLVLNNKDLFDEDSLGILKEIWSKGVVSLGENYDISNIDEWLDSSIKYDDSGVEALKLEIKNIINKNIGTGTFRGLYSMMASIDPIKNEYEEIDPISLKSKGALTNVKSGDIVVTLRALKEFFNVYDINDLAAYDDKGNIIGYYLLSVTNPADNMNSILPLRVRVINDDKHITIGFTPDTQEILRNRDFDGDHTITTVLPKGMKQIAPLLNDYIFNVFTAYDKISRSLSKKDTKDASLLNAHIQRIGSNEKVIAIGLKLDSILEKHKEDITLSNSVEAEINKLNKELTTTIKNSDEFKEAAIYMALISDEEQEAFIKKCVNTLGYISTFKGTKDVLRYVNNPSLFNYRKTDGNPTYTHLARKAIFSRKALTDSNIVDSEIGWHQKNLSIEDIEDKKIKQPLSDLYTPSIYLTSTLSSNIENEVKDEASYIKYINSVFKYILEGVTKDKFDTSESFSNYMDTLKNKELLTISGLTKEEYAERAKVLTMHALWELEYYTKSNKNVNNKFLKAMDSIATDDTFKNQLKVTKDLDDKLSQLSGRMKKMASKENRNRPLSDMLLSNEVSRLIGNTEDSHIRLKDGISNGANYSTVFITKGFLGNSPDDIVQTKTSKATSAVFDFIDGTNIKFNNFKKKPNAFIPKGTIIGTNKTTGDPVRAKNDMYINTVYKDGILVNYKESLESKKVSGSGFFKGIVTKERQTLYGKGSDKIDFIVDANNSTKNFNKYSQGIDLASIWKTAKRATFTDASGRKYDGYILENIPFNIIGDDLSYTQKLGLNDPSNIRRFEVMASDGAYSLLGLGRYGSTVLKGNSKDGFYIDFSEISKALQENLGDHNVTWADAGNAIMYLRSAALVNSMTEEEFMGLVNSFMPNQFKSRQDYLNNLRHSPEKINSEALLNEQNIMIRSLKKDRYIKLYNSSDLTKYIFGPEVNAKLNPTEPSTFSEEFYSDPKSPHSKASGKAEMTSDAIISKGAYISPSSRDVNDRNLIQSSYLHIPYDQFYRGITSRYLNQNDMIRALKNGVIGYTRHFDNSAMISNDFTPVDINMGTRLDSVINKNAFAGVVKTGIPGEPDRFKPTDTTMKPFEKGSEIHDVFYGYEDPTKPTFNSMIAKAQELGYITSTYDKKTHLAYLLALAFDRNKNKLEKMGALKGKDSVLVNKLTSQFVNDKEKMSYVRIHDNKKVSLAEAQKYINEGTKGYMLRKDVKDSIDKHKFTKDEIINFKKSGILDSDIKYNENIKQAKEDQERARIKFIASLNNINKDITNNDIKFTWDVSNSTEEYKSSLWTRSGISVKNADQLSVDVGIKNYSAESEYIKYETMEYLNNLKQSVANINSKEFEDFAKYRWLTASQQSDPDGFETRAKYMGVTDLTEPSKLKEAYDKFIAEYPDVVKAYDTYVNRIMDLAKEASQITNEPFDSYYIMFAPYVPRNKDVRYNVVLSNIKTMMGLNKYDPVSKRNAIEQNMMFDFFEGSKRIISDLSKVIATDNISKALLGSYQTNEDGKQVSIIDNKDILNKVFEIIDSDETFDNLKTYNYSFNSEISNKVLDVVALYTDIDIKGLRKASKNGNELLKNAYNQLRFKTITLRNMFEKETGVTASLSNVYRMAKDLNTVNESTRLIAEQTADAMWAEIVVAQRIIETSSKASDKLVKYIADLETDGYVLVNKFGQKVKRNGDIAPIVDGSLSYLKDNVELTMNSKNDTMFAQYVLEKALSGEIYLCRKDLADQLEEKIYTTKIPGRVKKALINISKTSASFQMSMPTKLLRRLISFTGFDYALDTVGNLDTIPYMSVAAKEIRAALQSNGKSIKPDSPLYGYLIRQGQPSLGSLPFSKKSQPLGLDPINFSDELDDNVISKFTSGITKPLELQNHLGRYALYLTALKSFEEGKPWYGSQYYNRDYIDKLSSNEDKAMYIMDYMLGSPGGFPYLSKKTSGLMMYATFPMNLTRTGGAYLMSMGKLFMEGVTEENANQWYNTVIMPSITTAGLAALSNVMLTAICDAYGVDEETEEEWKKEGVTLDPIGTLIGGTPSVVYDSINPAINLKNMHINPFTNEYNDNILKRGYGWFKANVLSSLNPALKMPIEIITGKDIYGDSAEGYQNADSLLNKTKKNQYTTLENGMKKVLGFFVGTGVADNVIDQYKIDDINSESNFVNTLWKGFTKGISSDLGNQKSWKKDTSNYYAFITDIKSFRSSNADSEYYQNESSPNSESSYQYNNSSYLSIEDMTEAEKLEYNRKYASRYGEYDETDYRRVSSTLKKYINRHESSVTIYNYIVKEYNENNVSEATMRAALDNNSLARKLKQLKNKDAYLNSLTNAEKIRLQNALEYEQEYYPLLEKLFPEEEYYSSSNYIPHYRWSGYSGGSSYPNYSSPRYFNYYPGKYYPKTFYYNKKVGGYTGPNLNRVQVNVSPQMAIWNQDNNLTRYETGINAENEPKWLRDKDYVSRVN